MASSSATSVAKHRILRKVATDLQETGLAAQDHWFLIQGDPASIANYRKYQAIVERSVDVFGDEVKASRWLSTPSADFDGKTPLQAAEDSGYNLSALEPVFIAIEHGIY